MCADSPRLNSAHILQAYLEECRPIRNPYSIQFDRLNSGKAILAASSTDQVQVLIDSLKQPSEGQIPLFLAALRWAILKSSPPLNLSQIELLAAHFAKTTDWELRKNGKWFLAAIEKFATQSPLSDAVRASLKDLKLHQLRHLTSPDRLASTKRIDDLLGVGRQFVLSPGDDWAESIIGEIEKTPVPRQAALTALLEHCQEGTAKPSERWWKIGRDLVDGLPGEDFDATLVTWLTRLDQFTASRREGGRLPIAETNSEIVRGLIRLAGLCATDETARCVGRFALRMFQKVPGAGALSVKHGTACLLALGRMPSSAALAQLAYLKVRIKHGNAQKEIDSALKFAAERLNVPREDLEEMAVPSYGLTTVGRLEEPLGDFTVELTVADSGKATIAWRKADGKLQKSVPASIKADHAEELKDLKATAKDIEKMLPAQRERIDGLFIEEKRWPVDVWRERYLDHPLVGILARRLIWQFKNTGLETSGIWLDDSIVNVDDEPIDWIDADGTTVELWHPIGRPMDDVLTWRHWLEQHEIRQPFKQAHRELYVLTDAERRTRTYSNRYAAHVIRQHQFHALCAARGWKNKLRLMVDDVYAPPEKRLEHWGLRAEFWIETIGENFGVDTTDAGTFLYLTTDQVRFYRLEADRHATHAFGGGYVTEGLQTPVNEPLPLDAIPPIVLSEILRDVDLFVGVASVGNDPTWNDGGPGGRYREYWQTFSFGDLTPSAQTRKQVLERLIPRLKIGPRCSFSEKFLVVRGDVRTYKIHLGSGNILMEPNDQYLCIVPDSSAVTKGDSVFLPFEGDRTLSIILSKAMLLADDARITDRTILSQIGPR